jgi:transcriptional regulator with XRE-family HTH domain
VDIKNAFGQSLKVVRKFRKLSQEDFSLASSRTYLSSLERGLKSPTIDKIDSLSKRLDVHPLTLMTLTYLCQKNETDPTNLMNLVHKEVATILDGFNLAKKKVEAD